MEESPNGSDTQRVRLSDESTVIEATSDEAGERLVSEISYLEHYVPELGRILKMREIRFGMVEDTSDQVSFRFMGKSGEIEGTISSQAKELGELCAEEEAAE